MYNLLIFKLLAKLLVNLFFDLLDDNACVGAVASRGGGAAASSGVGAAASRGVGAVSSRGVGVAVAGHLSANAADATKFKEMKSATDSAARWKCRKLVDCLLLFAPSLLLSSRFPNFPTTNARSDTLRFAQVTKTRVWMDESMLARQVVAPTGRPGRAEQREEQLHERTFCAGCGPDVELLVS